MVVTHVNPGDKILASQFNGLADFANGPTEVSQGTLFTKTPQGTIFNGGDTFTRTNGPRRFSECFSVTLGPGLIPSPMVSADTEMMCIWSTVPHFELMGELVAPCTPGDYGLMPIIPVLVDFTSQQLAFVPILPDIFGPSGLIPICDEKGAAGVRVYQIVGKTHAPDTSSGLAGALVVVIGSYDPAEMTSDNIVQALKRMPVYGQSYFSTLEDVVLRGEWQLYQYNNHLSADDGEVCPQTSYTLGALEVQLCPDADYGPYSRLSSTSLVPPQQYGYLNGTPTYNVQLYNFDKFKSTYSDVDDMSAASKPDGGGQEGKNYLSSFDVLLRHKARHPWALAGQATAALEYLPLSCLIGDVDSNIRSLHLSSVQTGTWTDPDTGKDTKYHQFFGFTDRVLDNYELSDGLDVVVRDYFTTGGNGARTNYISLSGLASKLSSNVEVDSWATQGAQRSIDWNTSSNKKYLQLYNFDKPGYDDTLRVNLVYGQHRYATKYGSGEYPDPYVEFVVRDRNNNIVKYDALDIYAPPISASDITDLTTVISAIVDRGCSCDLGPLSAKVDQLSSDLSNYWKVGGTNDDNCYGQSIGNSSQVLAIDIDNGGLWYESSQTLDWHNCELYNQNGADGPGDICLKWADRQGYDSGGNITLDWENGKLSKPGTGVESVNWKVGYAQDPSGSGVVVNWNTGQLWADGNTRTLDWKHKQLIGDWSTQNGGLTIASGNTLTIGNTSLSEAQLSALLALLQVVPNALQGV